MHRRTTNTGKKTSKDKIKQIIKLIKAIKRDPLEGTGKPEPRKHDLAEHWSRRIESPRDCRRPNFLREYDNENTKLHS